VNDHTGGEIHAEHPFATPAELRDPARQLRGRLAAPVTILTAGSGEAQTGLTVSSLLVAEGAPPVAYCLLGPESDLLDVVLATERFIVHVCSQDHRAAADLFAGIRPSPGGLFRDRTVVPTAYGPRLAEFGTYAYCSLVDARDESYSSLVRATIDEIVTDDLLDPLTYFRGAYRTLGP
jgi:3-hydroxy-9,10-secoandrosta-1,3,5(10)-triene-9,17-dione monooxygenase reductase component